MRAAFGEKYGARTYLDTFVGRKQRDTGLIDLSDEEISRRARDSTLPKRERRRYQREEKFRAQRSVQKRKKR